jgi:CheY-like chemotaxis protein
MRLMFPEGEDILVVDDDTLRRGMIEAILRDEGFPVTVASEGLGALRLIARHDFRLVIAALHLPGSLDGPATVRQARVRRPALKALFVAEYGVLPVWRSPASADVIAVPFQRWELLGCVFELLHRDPVADGADLARRWRCTLAAS